MQALGFALCHDLWYSTRVVRSNMKSPRAVSLTLRGARTSVLGPVCRTSSTVAQLEARSLSILSSRPRRPLDLLHRRIPCQSVAPKYLVCQRRKSSDDTSSSDGGLGRTALYDLHIENGGKMVPFGGYEMPVQYSDLSVGESHKWTREKASLFDVGHMYLQPLSTTHEKNCTDYFAFLGYNIFSLVPQPHHSSNQSLPPPSPHSLLSTPLYPASYTL